MNIGAYNNRNIFFKSNIKILNYWDFMDVLRKNRRDFYKKYQNHDDEGLSRCDECSIPLDENADYVKIVDSRECAFANYIDRCSVIGITNGKRVLFTHIYPNADENITARVLAQVKEEFRKKIKELRLENDDVRAVITGGSTTRDDLSEKSKNLTRQSYKLYDNLKKFLEDCKIPTSIIWGQRGDIRFEPRDKTNPMAADVFYLVANDTWYISSNFLDIDSAEYLKKAYRFIKIYDKGNDKDRDKLFINGQQVDTSVFADKTGESRVHKGAPL